MNTPALITRRSLDQLETDIIYLSSHINAHEYEFLVLVQEFDLRQGWKEYHFNHCSEWLNMKCGMAPGTAREKMRVANGLFHLPQISAAFQKGDLSYSKARYLTRIATPMAEKHLLDFAIKATASQVDLHNTGCLCTSLMARLCGLFIVRPEAENFYTLIFFVHLVNQSVLYIDTTREGAR